MPLPYNTIAATPPNSAPRPSKTRIGSQRPDIAPQVASSLRSDFAQSHAADWVPPTPVTQEDVALRHLKTEWSRSSSEEPTWDGYCSAKSILIADLQEFEIYVSPDGDKARRYELIGLHHLEVPRAKRLRFDGSLRIGGEEHYVEGNIVQDYSIEGFGDAEDPTVVVYIQSAIASRDPTYDIWYRLKSPTRLYERHHKPFLWVAQLAKHVLDFMDDQPAYSVGLESFRTDFQQWLTNRFLQQSDYQHWYKAISDGKDLRVTVNAHIEFLYQQAFNLPSSKALRTHPVWADCMVAGLTQVESQDQIVTDTLATPDVHQCFQHMYFGHAIRAKFPSKAVRATQRKRMAQLGFSQNSSESSCIASGAFITEGKSTPLARPYGNSPVQVGDVVAFDPRKSDKQKWRNADWEWLLYVHDIRLLSNGVQRLFGLYLYRPRETDISTAKYRYHNELFFSDNCNCEDGELLSTDINGQHDVEWTPSIIPTESFFVRQTYVTQDSAFVTYTRKHKICECKKAKTTVFDRYHRGDTIYVMKKAEGRKTLEPVIVHQKEEATGHFTIRRLARLRRDLSEQVERAQRGDIARNELVLTDEYEKIAASQIDRECHIRFISKSDVLQNCIPFPYSRGGAGNFWFFSMGLTIKDGTPRLIFLSRPPSNFNEGQDIVFRSGMNKLCGMSLFSGGGNLDRGIEEGGAVEIGTAVELDDAAIHTQRANTRDPTKKMLWYGSVDDHLNAALAGSEHPLIARIGDVNITIAGSPCPGFSMLQQNILSEKSIRNASHITTICSYVDLYRPEYAVLENVVSMAATRKGFEDQNVLSQLVAYLASMGYQVNQFIMDAWNYGSCQQRSRVILTIAAPGLDLIKQPKHTHSMLADHTHGRSLGMLPNGQRFGEREHYPTPFSHLTAGEVTADLPDIGNGNVQTCISQPSHRVSLQPGGKVRALLECIPRSPPGCGYREAHKLGLIPASLQKLGKETGKAFKRITKFGLVPTITTGLSIQDSRNGASLHWSQDRPITILEARRTQGYLDDEPIIGGLNAQYRIVGNGVDRQVAFALGLAIRQAFINNTQNSSNLDKATEPMQDLLVDVEEDIDHFSDAASISLGIQVYVSPSNRADTHSSASSKQLQQRPSLAVADFIEVPGLDGASDPRDIEPAAPPSTTTTAFLSLMSSTIVGGLTALTHRSKPSPAMPETTSPVPQGIPPLCLKRSRTETHHDTDASISRKRTTKSSNIPSPAAMRNITKHNANVRSTDAERSQQKRRHTRHSGLEVTFLPKQWNKRPEKECAPEK